MVQGQVHIGELARRASVPTSTVRYYERTGLLPPAPRTEAGYRSYDDGTLTRLRFIQSAQAAGFTLNQIRSILDLRDDGTAPCEHVRQLITDRLDEIDRRIRDLESARTELRRLRHRAASFPDSDCDSGSICGIVELKL